MIKQSLTLGWLAASNALLSVLVPWLIVTRLGVGAQSDAFFASGALPQVVFLLLSSSLMSVLVPLLAVQGKEVFEERAWGFFLGITGIFTALGIALFLTSQFWVPLLVPGFTPEGKALTIRLTNIQLISMVLNTAIVVLWAVYHARQRFIWAELSPVAANIVSLACLYLVLPVYGVVGAAWTTVLNNGLKAAFLLVVIGYWRRPHLDSSTVKEGWRRMKPFLLTQSYLRTDPLVDRFLTSTMASGSLSLFYIGQQAYSVVNQVVNKAIAAPMVPQLAIAAKANDWNRYKRIYRERLFAMAALAILSLPVLLLVGEPMLRLLIGHGGITAGNVHSLWWIMIALWGVLIGGTVGQITSAAFYAVGDTKTPARLYFFTFLFYLPAKILGFVEYGILGLAAVSSSYFMINFALQIFLVERMAGTPHGPVTDFTSVPSGIES